LSAQNPGGGGVTTGTTSKKGNLLKIYMRIKKYTKLVTFSYFANKG
jgi:hypothetical protein